MTYLLKDYYAGAWKEQDGDLGLEIEVEFLAPYVGEVPAPWKKKGDGSLRNYGYEFITDGTIKADPTKRPKLVQMLKEINAQKPIQDCFRTSVHTHVNVQHLEPIQIWNFMCAYWMFEIPLVDYCGPSRTGNMYCLRLKDAEGALKTLFYDLRCSMPFSSIDRHRIKYFGGNPATISDFGSFEIRTMRGVYDADLLDEWTTNLVSLRDTAKDYASPDALLDDFWHKGAGIMDKFFTPAFSDKLKAQKGWQDGISESAELLAQIAYALDWKNWQKTTEDNHKQVAAIRQHQFEQFRKQQDEFEVIRAAQRAEREARPARQAGFAGLPGAAGQWFIPEDDD